MRKSSGTDGHLSHAGCFHQVASAGVDPCDENIAALSSVMARPAITHLLSSERTARSSCGRRAELAGLRTC